MPQATASKFPLTIGLDLGSRVTQVAVMSTEGERVEERKIATTKVGVEQLIDRYPGARVVMEASTGTRWIHRVARERGHEVIVANPRKIPIITASIRKCDRNDARLLAEIGQVRPDFLSPVELRGDEYQRVRAKLFAREQLVRTRTRLCTFIRSQARAVGESLPGASTRYFARKITPLLPGSLASDLKPILATIQAISDQIDEMDADLSKLAKERYPQTNALSQVHGVGPLIALAFVATIGDPKRFKKSRAVGPYLGLVPRLDQSGASNPALPITKHGDRYMRSLLVSAATRILGPFGPDSDLKRFGTRILEKGGPRSRATARIAVARKLATLLHRLLVTGEVYDPLRHGEAA